MVVLMNITVLAFAQDVSTVDGLLERGQQAGIDLELVNQFAERAQAKGLTLGQTSELLRPAVTLAEENLPADLVLRKSLEGLAKGVPHARIQPVVQRIYQHTETTGSFIEGWMRRAEVQQMMGQKPGQPAAANVRHQLVESAVQAQMHQVPAKMVRKLLSDLPVNTKHHPIPVGNIGAALRVLPDFPGKALAEGEPVALLVTALDAGFEPQEIGQLPAAMRSALQQSHRPAAVLMRGAAGEIARGKPAAEVLATLFNGGLPGAPGLSPGVRPPGQEGPPDVGNRKGGVGQGPFKGQGGGPENGNSGAGRGQGGPPN